MITHLGEMARRKADKPLFYVQRDGRSLTMSYRRTRYAAAALARECKKHGIGEGSTVACSLHNGIELVLLAIAAAYGGFTLALFNPRLSYDERALRLAELENATAHARIVSMDESLLQRYMIDATGYDMATFSSLADEELPAAFILDLESYATECEDTFCPDAQGVVMFTSGSSGTPKAAFLPWSCIVGSAKAANEVLALEGCGVWQLVLPMCHIGGFQVMVRSIVDGSTFIVYERYQPARILNDVLSFHVTHISVVDKMLADLLTCDHDKVIGQYACILLGGAGLNDKTLRQALKAKAHVYASYGMTETASLIAVAPVTKNFSGALRVLPGYDVRIMRPDKQGIGQLHVSGPGVFSHYLNARKAMSADNYFVTGDRASVDRSGFLHVYERTEDLIISGGENIYPAEIRDALLRVPGIKDAYVFGTADETWGYRPVAFVEADYSAAALEADHETLGLDLQETGIAPATCPQEFAHMVHAYLESRMSRLHHPKHILVLDAFPRTVAGKTDRIALKQLYDKRIDIKSVTLYRIKQPFVHPVKTAKHEVRFRESFFVEVKDWAGRTGIAECVSFTTNWYLPETLDEDFEIVRDRIAPLIMNERYTHPSEVAASLATFPVLAAYPMAKAAVEPALWDLYGKIVGQPLSRLIGGSDQEKVLGGVVIGLGSADEVCAAVDRAVQQGYTRVKLKVEPCHALEVVTAVRERHPDLMLMLDANQSFNETHLDVLCKLDKLNLACIEEPYDPAYVPLDGQRNLFARLSRLQDSLKTPVCLDESVVTAADMEQAMGFDNLRCYALKIAKFGGVQPTLDIYHWMREQGKIVWMGGMFDTGVSKRLHAAFCALPGMDIPGDLSDYAAYFQNDCALPPLELEQGELRLNRADYAFGLGCELDRDYIRACVVDEVTIVGSARER